MRPFTCFNIDPANPASKVAVALNAQAARDKTSLLHAKGNEEMYCIYNFSFVLLTWLLGICRNVRLAGKFRIQTKYMR